MVSIVKASFSMSDWRAWSVADCRERRTASDKISLILRAVDGASAGSLDGC
jgi:hypothetical protein